MNGLHPQFGDLIEQTVFTLSNQSSVLDTLFLFFLLRQMIDATVVQLSDAEFVTRPTHDTNSVAVILRHLGGNLQSRWTDFLTTDGEKPDRDRDTEFLDWDGDRQSLMRHFDRGWENT